MWNFLSKQPELFQENLMQNNRHFSSKINITKINFYFKYLDDRMVEGEAIKGDTHLGEEDSNLAEQNA